MTVLICNEIKHLTQLRTSFCFPFDVNWSVTFTAVSGGQARGKKTPPIFESQFENRMFT